MYCNVLTPTLKTKTAFFLPRLFMKINSSKCPLPLKMGENEAVKSMACSELIADKDIRSPIWNPIPLLQLDLAVRITEFLKCRHKTISNTMFINYSKFLYALEAPFFFSMVNSGKWNTNGNGQWTALPGVCPNKTIHALSQYFITRSHPLKNPIN